MSLYIESPQMMVNSSMANTVIDTTMAKIPEGALMYFNDETDAVLESNAPPVKATSIAVPPNMRKQKI